MLKFELFWNVLMTKHILNLSWRWQAESVVGIIAVPITIIGRLFHIVTPRGDTMHFWPSEHSYLHSIIEPCWICSNKQRNKYYCMVRSGHRDFRANIICSMRFRTFLSLVTYHDHRLILSVSSESRCSHWSMSSERETVQQQQQHNWVIWILVVFCRNLVEDKRIIQYPFEALPNHCNLQLNTFSTTKYRKINLN